MEEDGRAGGGGFTPRTTRTTTARGRRDNRNYLDPSCEHLENAQDHDMGMDQELYRFRAIIGHQGPLLASDPDWKGSKYNVQVEWETGEITFEPLSIIAADDPVTCAAYAKENDLLALEGWCRFRRLAKKDKVLARIHFEGPLDKQAIPPQSRQESQQTRTTSSSKLPPTAVLQLEQPRQQREQLQPPHGGKRTSNSSSHNNNHSASIIFIFWGSFSRDGYTHPKVYLSMFSSSKNTSTVVF